MINQLVKKETYAVPVSQYFDDLYSAVFVKIYLKGDAYNILIPKLNLVSYSDIGLGLSLTKALLRVQ